MPHRTQSWKVQTSIRRFRDCPCRKARSAIPIQHGNQHHLLDAEAFQEERYQQDAECFGYLRQRNQDVGMLHSESAGIFGNTAETADVGIANPLVICKETPSSMEKMKKTAIFFCLNSVKARKPVPLPMIWHCRPCWWGIPAGSAHIRHTLLR